MVTPVALSGKRVAPLDCRRRRFAGWARTGGADGSVSLEGGGLAGSTEPSSARWTTLPAKRLRKSALMDLAYITAVGRLSSKFDSPLKLTILH